MKKIFLCNLLSLCVASGAVAAEDSLLRPKALVDVLGKYSSQINKSHQSKLMVRCCDSYIDKQQLDLEHFILCCNSSIGQDTANAGTCTSMAIDMRDTHNRYTKSVAVPVFTSVNQCIPGQDNPKKNVPCPYYFGATVSCDMNCVGNVWLYTINECQTGNSVQNGICVADSVITPGITDGNGTTGGGQVGVGTVGDNQTGNENGNTIVASTKCTQEFLDSRNAATGKDCEGSCCITECKTGFIPTLYGAAGIIDLGSEPDVECIKNVPTVASTKCTQAFLSSHNATKGNDCEGSCCITECKTGFVPTLYGTNSFYGLGTEPEVKCSKNVTTILAKPGQLCIEQSLEKIHATAGTYQKDASGELVCVPTKCERDYVLKAGKCVKPQVGDVCPDTDLPANAAAGTYQKTVSGELRCFATSCIDSTKHDLDKQDGRCYSDNHYRFNARCHNSGGETFMNGSYTGCKKKNMTKAECDGFIVNLQYAVKVRFVSGDKVSGGDNDKMYCLPNF